MEIIEARYLFVSVKHDDSREDMLVSVEEKTRRSCEEEEEEEEESCLSDRSPAEYKQPDFTENKAPPPSV